MLTNLVAKPRLLTVELWALGDLVIASPFLQAASQAYEITLLAKPFAGDLQRRFWPAVQVVPFIAPWTAFRGKYRLWNWPWREIFRLRHLRHPRFDLGVSARWDPRDHVLLQALGARRRLGFPRLHSQSFLTESLPRPPATAHRFEYWRTLARVLGLELPPRERLATSPRQTDGRVLVHTGAGQPVRVWPLERYRNLVERLRKERYAVRVACDPAQRAWWLQAGEDTVSTAKTISELIALVESAAAFIGNDSGPGHLAAFCGVPTFTLFGPQLPEWFAPMHPAAEWLPGKPCRFKPCFDSCRFPQPYCLLDTSEAEVWARVVPFVARHAATIAAKP